MVETPFKFDPVFRVAGKRGRSGSPRRPVADSRRPPGRRGTPRSAASLGLADEALGSGWRGRPCKSGRCRRCRRAVLPGSEDAAFGRQPGDVGETDERPVRTPVPYRQKQRVIPVGECAMTICDKPFTRFGRRGQRNRLADHMLELAFAKCTDGFAPRGQQLSLSGIGDAGRTAGAHRDAVSANSMGREKTCISSRYALY